MKRHAWLLELSGSLFGGASNNHNLCERLNNCDRAWPYQREYSDQLSGALTILSAARSEAAMRPAVTRACSVQSSAKLAEMDGCSKSEEVIVRVMEKNEADTLRKST